MAKFPRTATILSPLDDRIFKLLLTHPDSKSILMDIISCVIEKSVTDVAIRNNELLAQDTEEKQERLDINCTINNGEQINIEMQSSHMAEKAGGGHKNLKNKALYYLCDLFSGQSSKGKSYDELAQTIQITFCAYTVFPDNTRFVSRFQMKNEQGLPLADSIGIVFIELSKLNDIVKKPVTEMTSLEMWSVFLEYADSGAHRDVINNIISIKEEINMASTLLASISQDERERAVNMSRRKYQTDMESDKVTMYKEGVREGIKEGLREAAIKMKHSGVDAAQIAAFTGLSDDEIKRL